MIKKKTAITAGVVFLVLAFFAGCGENAGQKEYKKAVDAWNSGDLVRAKGLFLRWGEPVPRFSITHECIRKKTKFDTSHAIHPSVWFPDRKWKYDAELFEDVRTSNSYGWSMSMLWLP